MRLFSSASRLAEPFSHTTRTPHGFSLKRLSSHFFVFFYYFYYFFFFFFFFFFFNLFFCFLLLRVT